MNAPTILTVAPGASNLHYCEFGAQGTELILRNFGRIAIAPHSGSAGIPSREEALQRALAKLTGSRLIQGRHAAVAIPSGQVFSKFIKLPSVDDLKLKQMMYYEAKQNLPFPPEDMVWDFAPSGESIAGEADYLLAGAKPETVEALFASAESAGLRIDLLDLPQAALANAFWFNYSDLPGCSLLADIGARNTNLLFFQGGKFYCRTLSLGSNALTQAFMAEARCSFEEAERFKIDQGFVHPGGAIELAENDDQLLFSKLAREWVARLRQQIAQTVQHFRTQTRGSNPERIFLAGWGASLGGVEEFFAEEFKVPVDLFNPFRRIEAGPEVDETELAKCAHAQGESVGLGLRMVMNCPFEFNLVPKAVKTKRIWDQKKPYFFATGVCLLVSLFSAGYFYGELARVKRESLSFLQPGVEKLAAKSAKLKQEQAAIQKTKSEVDQLTGLLQQRFFWMQNLKSMQTALMRAEARGSSPGKPAGVWVESLKPITATSEEEPQPAAQGPFPQGIPEYMLRDPAMIRRYWPEYFERAKRIAQPEFPDNGSKPKQTEEPQRYTMLLRAVNLNSAKNPGQNGLLAYDVAESFREEPAFNHPHTGLREHIENAPPDALTFTFDMNLEALPK
jgi:type IV pilus assembly protein PilM